MNLDFQGYMSWYFSVFNELRREVFVRFVDIGGIVNHHCLNFLFIIQSNLIVRKRRGR